MVLALLGAAFLLVTHIPRTVAVFVIAGFIAVGIAPLVSRLERIMSRGFAIASVYALLAAIVVLVLLLVVPATLAQIEVLAVNSSGYIAIVQSWLDNAQAFLLHHVGRQYLPPSANNLRGYIADRVSTAVSATLASFAQVLIGTFTAFLIGISALVLSAFFIWRGDKLADSVFGLLPASRRGSAHMLGVELVHVFGGYVTGQVTVCALVGALVFGFTFAVGFKFALLLAVVTALGYAVPFAGLVIAHLLGLVLAIPQGGQTTIWVQVILFLIGRLADNVFVPKIMSESIGVSPIVVMFSTFAGGELFGLPGLLLGIPIAAIARVAWRFYRSRPLEEQVAALVGESAAPASELAFEREIDLEKSFEAG